MTSSDPYIIDRDHDFCFQDDQMYNPSETFVSISIPNSLIQGHFNFGYGERSPKSNNYNVEALFTDTKPNCQEHYRFDFEEPEKELFNLDKGESTNLLDVDDKPDFFRKPMDKKERK